VTVHSVLKLPGAIYELFGARGSAHRRGTAQQVGRSRVRFAVVSLEFFILCRNLRTVTLLCVKSVAAWRSHLI
jgi:hypothetical protein